MRWSVVTDDASLAMLWPSWEALWFRVPRAWPFASPAWLRPWWELFGTGRPVVATVEGPSGLLGVLPLYELDMKLLPIGVGISDYFDILLAPDAPEAAADRLLGLALDATRCHRCDLPDLPQGARLEGAAAPDGWLAERWGGPVCPVLRLAPEPEIPKGMRRDVRQARHRAERAGGWMIETARAETLGEGLEQLIRLHGARWQGKGEAGVLSDPRVLSFHRLAAPALLEAGALRLEALLLRGRVVAVAHALLARNRLCFYLAGFDPDAAFESPGTILIGHMIEEAVREGRQEVHFLRGGEAYKYAWGAIDRPNSGLSLVRT
mgnify:CR=1 FL=1